MKSLRNSFTFRARLPLEDEVRFFQNFLHRGELTGQIAQHADVLRTLPWKQDAEFPERFAAAKIDAVGRLPNDSFADFSINASTASMVVPIDGPSFASTKTQRYSASVWNSLRDVVAFVAAASQFSDFHSFNADFRSATESDDTAAICTPPSQSMPGFGRLMLFEHAMEIAAAEAKGADAGPARMLCRRQPRTLFRVDVERRFVRTASNSAGDSTLIVGGKTL